MRVLILVIITVLLSGGKAFAQNKRVLDSLNKKLSESKADSLVSKTLNSIAKQYWTSNPDTSLILLNKSIQIAEKIRDKKYLCNAILYKAYTFTALDNFDSSIANYKSGIELAEKHKQLKPLGQMLSGLGNVYNIYGDYEKAIKYYMEALKIQESEKEYNGLAKTYNSLGVLMDWQGDFDKALNYYRHALKLKMDAKDSNAIGMTLNNIGNSHGDKLNLDSSIYYHKWALDIRIKINDRNGMGQSYINLGNSYSKQKKSEEALKCYITAIDIFKENEDELNLARSYYNLGNEYYLLGQMEKGYPYIKLAEPLADVMGIKELQKDVYSNLLKYYSIKNEFKQAFEYSQKYQAVKDSLYNESKNKEIQSLNTKYETSQKEQQIINLNQQNKIQDLDIKQKRTTLYSLIGVGVFLLLIAFILLNRNRLKQRVNKELELKNKTIEHQKELVEEKNKEITDSINYAKRIQTALLPGIEHFREILPNSFVLFKPKDIVSGDFFWITEKAGFVFYVAADCTGHGVPGAFMSMLGTSFLNEIINEKHILEPCDILDLLKIKIIKALKQKGEVGSNKDGMDMVLCRLEKETNKLCFAAANNPLWLLRDNAIVEYKADKQPVGIGSDNFEHFNQHIIELKKGDAVYIFSDGYADQFGGPKGKKFKYKQLEEILVASAGLPMEKQSEALDAAFESWKGQLEQVDDVCVIGVLI